MRSARSAANFRVGLGLAGDRSLLLQPSGLDVFQEYRISIACERGLPTGTAPDPDTFADSKRRRLTAISVLRVQLFSCFMRRQ